MTLSRIKAMVTGNYPSFLEFFNNFNKNNILLEDNIVSQLRRHNRKTVFMGDDTWITLFNSSFFDVSYPLDSFNTFDLDTVDHTSFAILQNRYLNNTDINNNNNERRFDLLICHTLGIDHAGHSYSPESV